MAVAKRIVVYILAAALSVGFILPSVSADAYNEGDYSLVPLFSETNEYYVYNSGTGMETLTDVHSVWSNQYSYIRWVVPSDTYVQQIYFSIVVPDNSNFDPTQVFALVNGQEKNVTFVGGHSNITYYRLDHYNNVYDIEIGQRGSYFGYFTVFDIYGTIQDLVPINFGSFSAIGNYGTVDGLYRSNINSLEGPFPLTIQKQTSATDSFSLFAADCTLEVDTDLGASSFADYFIFDVYTCGAAVDFGAVLLDDDGDTIASLQTDTDISGIITDYDVSFGSNTMRYGIHRYQVLVKTENFNLDNKNIQLIFNVEGVHLDADDVFPRGIYAEIVRGFARPTYIDEPWYADIVGWMKRGFQSVVDKLEEVFNGDSTAADDLENMEQQLEELTPTINNQEVIDNIQGSVNEVLPEEDLNVIGLQIRDLFYVAPTIYFVLPFTLALIGYLLYGKRS